MDILAHRGYWLKEKEKNTKVAFERAFSNGFGIETDIRDYAGKLVISHNIADTNSLQFTDFLELYLKSGNSLPLALNIKSDGLQELLKKYLVNYQIKNYFLFDMSVPEQIVYLNQNFQIFSRQSEFETSIVFYEEVQGIWMDEFAEDWIDQNSIEKHHQNKKKIGIISSEIHKKENCRLWNLLKKVDTSSIMLCTDVPKKAREFFYG